MIAVRDQKSKMLFNVCIFTYGNRLKDSFERFFEFVSLFVSLKVDDCLEAFILYIHMDDDLY